MTRPPRLTAMLLLTATALLTGCGPTATGSNPSQQVRPAAGACEPTPADLSHDGLTTLYAKRAAQLAGALEAGLGGKASPEAVVQRVAPCLELEPVEGSERAVWVIRMNDSLYLGFPQQFGLLAWQHSGAWRVRPLHDPEGASGAYPRLAVDRDGGYDLLTTTLTNGTGRYGSFRAYRLGAELQLLWESPEYEKFAGQILSPDLLLATYRAPQVWEEPHLFQGNCCMPINGQTLWIRRGDRFTEQAARLHPSIHYTTSIFLGALQAGNLDLARQWAVDGLTVTPGPFPMPERFPEEVEAIDAAEAGWWEAIPAELRGPAPSATAYEWPAGAHRLRLERVGGNWKVAGWRP